MTTTVPSPDTADTNVNPQRMHDLSGGEVLLIRTMRRWALAVGDDRHGHFQAIMGDFSNMVPDDHLDALSATVRLLREITRGAGRVLRHHQPNCPCFCADEIAFVTLVAALQAGEFSLADKLAGWLVEDEHVCEVTAAGRRLARVLQRNGIEIPLRQRRRSGAWRGSARVTHAANATIH